MFDTLSRPIPRRQISRLLYVDLAVILVLVIFPVRSGWVAYRAARDARDEQQGITLGWDRQIRQARQADREHPQLIGEIRAASSMLARQSRSLRSPEEVAAILEEVRDLAVRMNLGGVTITPRALEPQTGFQLHEMMVSSTGTYREHLEFIHALRNQTGLFIFSAMTLRVETDDARRPRLRMELGPRTVLVEDLIPLSEIDLIIDEYAVGSEPDSTAAEAGEGGDEGGIGTGDGDR